MYIIDIYILFIFWRQDIKCYHSSLQEHLVLVLINIYIYYSINMVPHYRVNFSKTAPL